jgi:7-cyano-7-deazaguanine synthase
MERNLAHVVLLSGGADSATVLGIAAAKVAAEREAGRTSKLIAFHCNYGQITEMRELSCFRSLCEHYMIPNEHRYVVDIGFLKQIGGSSLTDASVAVESDGDAIVNARVPTSYVPFRNGNLLSIAAAVAAKHDATDIWCGVVDEDASGYPDCRPAFIEFMEAAINAGLPDGHDIVINAPLINAKKDQIIQAGNEMSVPYELTWSCYQGDQEACGVCDSCRLRVASFLKLGLDDPIKYKDYEAAKVAAQVAMPS